MRWIDGLVGGLVAGLTSMVFFVLVGVVWLHETTCGDFFLQATRLFPSLRGAPASPQMTVLGSILYLALAALLGLVYGLLAHSRPSMRRLPTSLYWGTFYGIAVWLLLHDVLVIWTGVVDIQPLWEGLVGCVLFGLVLSEVSAVAARRVALNSQNLESLALPSMPPG